MSTLEPGRKRRRPRLGLADILWLVVIALIIANTVGVLLHSAS